MSNVKSTDGTPPPALMWSFYVLVGISVLATGGISISLAATPGPLTGILFAVSAVTLVTALILAGRVMIAVERGHRQTMP